MTDVGGFLKKEREGRGISLRDISDATKIGMEFLKAIEENHFEKLPAEVFAIGFIRNYAKYLGLNEEEVTSMYKQYVQERRENEFKNQKIIERKKKFPYLFLIFSLIAVALIVGIVILTSNNSKLSMGEQTFAKNKYSEAVTYPTKITEVAAENESPVTAPVNKLHREFLIVLKGENTGGKPVWVGYCSDETCKLDRSQWESLFLKEGEEIRIKGEKIIGVISGNGGKVRIFKNNKDIGLMGKPGSVRIKFFRLKK